MIGLGLSIPQLAAKRGNGGQFAGSSLNLDFTSGNQTLDQRITFSRASNATVTGPDGTLQYAPHNLLTFSEQFDNVAWVKTRSAVVANAETAPDGTTTADKLTDDGLSTGVGYTGQAVTFLAGTTYYASVFVKAAEFASCTAYLTDPSGITTGTTSSFNLATGVVISGAQCGISPVGNGWFRIWVFGTPSAGSGTFRILLPSDTATGNGLYIWGAQLNVGSLQPYYPTTAAAYYGPRFDYDPVTLAPRGLLIEEQRTNLLLQSETLDNAAWTKTEWSIVQNVTTSPDGALSADRVVRPNTNSTFSSITQNVTVASGTPHTLTCYVKADQYKKFGLREGAATGAYATFNLTTGTIIETSAGSGTSVSASISTFSNGWYRCSLTITFVGTSFGVRLNPLPDSYTSGSPAYSWAGNTTDGIFIWGAQLEAGAFATSYIPTSGAAATRAADVAVMTGANFSNWYRQDEGTIYVEISSAAPTVAGTARRIANINNGTENNRITVAWAGVTGAAAAFVTDGGAAQCAFNSPGGAYPFPTKAALAYKINDFNTAVNGAGFATDTSGTVPTVDRMTLGDLVTGGTGPQNLNGHIRRIAYFPRRLSDAELQGITS